MTTTCPNNRTLTAKAESLSGSEQDIREFVKGKRLSIRLVFSFLQKHAKKILENKHKVVELLSKALAFVKRLSNIPFLRNRFVDIPNLCDMLMDVINGVYKEVPYSSIVMIVIAIIYMVSPIDLLPDSIPFAGILDDAAILKVVLDTIKNDLDSYGYWKATQTTH